MQTIQLGLCTGWSEVLLVAHTTLLEISSTGSIYRGLGSEQKRIDYTLLVFCAVYLCRSQQRHVSWAMLVPNRGWSVFLNDTAYLFPFRFVFRQSDAIQYGIFFLINTNLGPPCTTFVQEIVFLTWQYHKGRLFWFRINNNNNNNINNNKVWEE